MFKGEYLPKHKYIAFEKRRKGRGSKNLCIRHMHLHSKSEVSWPNIIKLRLKNEVKLSIIIDKYKWD